MLKQDLEADQKQDDAARNFGLGLPAGAEKIADLHARAGDHKGGHADDGHAEQGVEKRACGDEPERDAGEGDPDRQRVDAGGDGHDEHGPEVHARRGVFLLL